MSAAASLAGLALFAVLLCAAAWTDLRSYRIPNGLPLLLALAAVVVALPLGSAAWDARGLSAVVVGLAAVSLYLARGLGGGDVKLMTAAALWIPFPSLPLFVLALALAGGVQALATLSVRRFAASATVGADAAPRMRMPYGVSIAAAGLAWALAQAVALAQPAV